MSRSALWRQESKAKEREIAAEETWENALAEGKVWKITYYFIQRLISLFLGVSDFFQRMEY